MAALKILTHKGRPCSGATAPTERCAITVITHEAADMMNSGHFSTNNFQRLENHCARASGAKVILCNGQ